MSVPLVIYLSQSLPDEYNDLQTSCRLQST